MRSPHFDLPYLTNCRTESPGLLLREKKKDSLPTLQASDSLFLSSVFEGLRVRFTCTMPVRSPVEVYPDVVVDL